MSPGTAGALYCALRMGDFGGSSMKPSGTVQVNSPDALPDGSKDTAGAWTGIGVSGALPCSCGAGASSPAPAEALAVRPSCALPPQAAVRRSAAVRVHARVTGHDVPCSTIEVSPRVFAGDYARPVRPGDSSSGAPRLSPRSPPRPGTRG